MPKSLAFLRICGRARSINREKKRIYPPFYVTDVMSNCGSKITNALHKAGVDQVDDIRLVVDKLQELPGVGRVVAERIQKLYFCAVNGKPLEVEAKEVNTEAWSMNIAPEPLLDTEDFRPRTSRLIDEG